nr:minus gamete specific protein [Volvox reticuliferus]
MKGTAGDGSTHCKWGLPSLPDSNAAPEAPGNCGRVATRRDRDVKHVLFSNQDANLKDIACQVSSLDHQVADKAVVKLWELTVLTRCNRVANQLALVDLGGLVLLLEYVAARFTDNATNDDTAAANMALLVLENLSTNILLHQEIISNDALLQLLLTTIRKQMQQAIRANAAKVLVNLTFSNPQLQDMVARAGAVSAAFALLREPEVALARQGAWLLSHLTASHGCVAFEELGRQLDVLESLRDLLILSEDRTTKARVCEVLCNLARGDAGLNANLSQVGMVPALMMVIDPSGDRRQGPEVVAPALLTLAALTVAFGGTILHDVSQLATHLAGILDYSNLVTHDYDMPRVMMASHALIYSMGTFVAKDMLDQNVTGYPEHVRELLQESGYVSFRQSLLVLGLEQPRYVAASLGKDLGGPHCFVANATHQVNIELLPLLRHDNTRMVINACARLYQIATCLRDHPEGRLVLCNSSLIVVLQDLLASGQSAVLQATLSLVDALAEIPELVPLLVEKGIMDLVNSLSDQQPLVATTDHSGVSAGEIEATTVSVNVLPMPGMQDKETRKGLGANGIGEGSAATVKCNDPLVKMLAERALVTMFLAQCTQNR